MLSAAVPLPCACCNAFEREHLNKAAGGSEKAVWEYTFPAPPRCGRCREGWESTLGRHSGRAIGISAIIGAISLVVRKRVLAWGLRSVALVVAFAALRSFLKRGTKILSIALPEESVEIIERSIEAACVAEKGSKYRAHGTFIHHLAGIKMPSTTKMCLLAWMPYIIDGWMKEKHGFARKLLPNGHSLVTSDPVPIDTHRGNPDVDGKMPGTMLNGDEFGEEDRVDADVLDIPQPRFLAHPIGPDIQPTEVMESSVGNLKAGLAKRVQPLPFKASKDMRRKIIKTVSSIVENVFTKERILKWREENPDFSEMASKKWSQDRFHHAWDEVLAEHGCYVEQEFMIKVNEALPAKGKAPRPLIQCGDKGQIMMLMPVKCFEDLLFDYFEDASIKHVPKYDAMKRTAFRLALPKTKIIEGDGSAWDSCCGPEIRGLTENVVIEHIIDVLMHDAQIPREWMDAMLKDMKKAKIRGKAKMVGFLSGKAKVMIDAIRQSGHRGTSAFNYFINLVCWLCVICDEPWKMIPKTRSVSGMHLAEWYISAVDKQWYRLRYMFEGDDSAISTTEVLDAEEVERLWASLGFRMKLIFVDGKLTFTGYDFQCDENGPTDCFLPEIPRNISSSSWSCSSLLKQHPEKAHEIGMAAMLARAENFVDYGPLCAYFASLGIAHAEKHGDRAIDQTEAMHLGIHECSSVLERLLFLRDTAEYPSRRMNKFVEKVLAGAVSHEENIRALSSHFDDPLDTHAALCQLPRAMWGISGLEAARR